MINAPPTLENQLQHDRMVRAQVALQRGEMQVPSGAGKLKRPDAQQAGQQQEGRLIARWSHRRIPHQTWNSFVWDTTPDNQHP